MIHAFCKSFITIVVDMLLTCFDAKYLNTVYVDKSLKSHGLIQAFSRTNRVLNATKPCGHILNFCQQQGSVDAALTLFSGEHLDRAREIWLVDKALVVINKFKKAVTELDSFMQSQGLATRPEHVSQLRGDAVRAQFINRFKEVQRIKTQLDPYTDLTDEQRKQIDRTLPNDDLRAFQSAYLVTVRCLKDLLGKLGQNGAPANPDVDQLDFELVLFASALVDYDYIIELIANNSKEGSDRLTISRDQLIGLIESDAKFLNDREEITEYVRSLRKGGGLNEFEITASYQRFKAEQRARQINDLARTYGIPNESLSAFINTILRRMIFDGEELTDLMELLDLGWSARRTRELDLMGDLVPLLNKWASCRSISGLNAWERVAI